MEDRSLLGIQLDSFTKKEVLEKIKKYIHQPTGFFHIVSLNLENMVIAQEDIIFKQVVSCAQIKINDGAGILWASKLKGLGIKERLTGVDLMKELLEMGKRESLSVLLIGGKPKLADSLAKRYSKENPQMKIIGIEGIKNIHSPKPEEEQKIFDIVGKLTPQIILVAFGSPNQEKWLYKNKHHFIAAVCMGVGQGFDVEAGIVKRAPDWMQVVGLEWFYRLITQPWRWRRQLRLIKFIWLVWKNRFLTF